MEFTNPSPQLQTVLAFLQAVTDQIVDDMLKHVSDDFEWHWVTPGFDTLGPRVKNKEQTRDFFTRFGNSFVKDFKLIFLDYVEMPGKIVFQMTSTGDLVSGTGKYENQYVWIFHIVEVEGQGPKIKVAKEFFDSLYCAKLWGVLSDADKGQLSGTAT